MKKNYKSDFDIILTLKTCVRHEDGTCSKRDVGWPEHDWVATFRTESGLREYVASRKGDTLVNCFNDNGRIHVVLNNHRLGKGVLRVDFHSEIPNAIYPDGIQDLYEPQPLDIELVDGPGDCAGAAEVEVLLPYIKGDRGEKLTYGDLTEQDKEDLIAPIKESINKAIEEKQDKLSVTADFDLTENLLSLTDIGKRRLFDDLWASINGTKLANGNYRMGADGKELTYAEALVRCERNGFINHFNTAAGDDGGYNETTGFFELNGIKDIGYAEALRIMDVSTWPKLDLGGSYLSDIKLSIRTALPLNTPIMSVYSLRAFAHNNTDIEVININQGMYSSCSSIEQAFGYCLKLRSILGVITANFTSAALARSAFGDCRSLEDVRLHHIRCSISFAHSPRLSLDSIDYMITNAANTGAITLTFHPDVYAKLTGDTANEAAAALTEEELAQWVAITEAAAAKNISFATV